LKGCNFDGWSQNRCSSDWVKGWPHAAWHCHGNGRGAVNQHRTGTPLQSGLPLAAGAADSLGMDPRCVAVFVGSRDPDKARILGGVPVGADRDPPVQRILDVESMVILGTLRVFPGSMSLFYCGSSATFKKKVTLRDRCDSLPLPKREPNLPGSGESEIRGQLACTFRWGRAYAPAQGCGRVD
jgi:hypothetical protein